ncbi:hypothetical protein [Streptomyces sp. NBC_01462]|uniref:hypothetical protein n=1 Tax=Streptomyces sp. NBC_01462 TaxID=2903876 RepID=UPI002E33F35D|nr:hypothetical protein [Streptomyces sp. NBC_01462]
MAADQMPAAVALFLAVVIAFWPGAVIAKVLDALANVHEPRQRRLARSLQDESIRRTPWLPHL